MVLSTCMSVLLLCLSSVPQYISMYSDIGQKSNTMIFSDQPANINALMAQASAVVNAVGNSTTPDASTGNNKE